MFIFIFVFLFPSVKSSKSLKINHSHTINKKRFASLRTEPTVTFVCLSFVPSLNKVMKYSVID